MNVPEQTKTEKDTLSITLKQNRALISRSCLFHEWENHAQAHSKHTHTHSHLGKDVLSKMPYNL